MATTNTMIVTNKAAATLSRPAARHRKDKLPMLTQFSTKLPLRFWSKVYAAPTGCWLWQAATNGRQRYGQFQWERRRQLAHRVSYEALVGAFPSGLESDHICRIRLCVNPLHIEPVTKQENIRRGRAGQQVLARTHCAQGHPYSGTNLRYHNGTRRKIVRWRLCRECARQWQINRRARRRAQATEIAERAWA